MRSTLLVGFGAWAFTWGAVLVNGTPARAYLPAGVFAATGQTWRIVAQRSLLL